MRGKGRRVDGQMEEGRKERFYLTMHSKTYGKGPLI